VNKRHGLTLVEVLVALAVIAITVSMFLYFADALRLTRISKEETTASAYARNYLDSLRGLWLVRDNYLNKLDYAEPQNIPAGYEVKVTILDEAGKAVASYPGGAGGSNFSPLRTVTISLTDEAGQVYEMSTQISRPLQ
jgi:prepilin-type N-terminal cleavage/methylation domain-containing protein